MNSNTYPGLNNQNCQNPKYYCKSHQVYLSDDDVRKKKCLAKMTPDMISTCRCNWLLTIDEYEAEKKLYRDDLQKIRHSRIAEGRKGRF